MGNNDSLNYSNLKFLFSMSMCLHVIHDPTSFYLLFLSCQNKDYVHSMWHLERH